LENRIAGIARGLERLEHRSRSHAGKTGSAKKTSASAKKKSAAAKTSGSDV
jgi:hypothetical protein